jgi:hypothetical protein
MAIGEAGCSEHYSERLSPFGLSNPHPSATDPLIGHAADLVGNLALAANLAFAGVAWLLWRYIKRGPTLRQYATLLDMYDTAAGTGWMLAIALIGLFARPPRWDGSFPS